LKVACKRSVAHGSLTNTAARLHGCTAARLPLSDQALPMCRLLFEHLSKSLRS